MKLIIFGATGGTGLALIEQGLAAGHEVTAFTRRAFDTRARIVVGDIFDSASVAGAMTGHDVALSCLGTRPWRHVDICSLGTANIVSTMKQGGVRRLIAMSSQGVGDSRLGPVARVMAALVIRKSLRDKRVMEDQLAASDVDWIVVRPGLLTNGKPRGRWRTAVDNSIRGGFIARADVAAFMLQQLDSTEWLKQRPVLVW
jgi:putative NADH-flavin reductase